MKIPTKALFISLVCLSLGLSGRAEETVPASGPVLFTTMAWDVFSTEDDFSLNYRSAGKSQVAEIPWRMRSVVMECQGGPLVFTRTIETAEGPVEMPVATADIPDGASRVMLIFSRGSDPTGESALRVTVVDDSYEVFPGRSVRILNSTGTTLGGLLGKQSFEVASGHDRVVPAAAPEAGELLPFKLARLEQGGWRRLRSTGLPMSEGSRVLLFVMDDPQAPGKPGLVMIRDQVVR